MRPAVIGATVGVFLVIFVAVWVYLASQNMVPLVGGQLQNLSWPARFGGLVVLIALLGVLFAQTKKR